MSEWKMGMQQFWWKVKVNEYEHYSIRRTHTNQHAHTHVTLNRIYIYLVYKYVYIYMYKVVSNRLETY